MLNSWQVTQKKCKNKNFFYYFYFVYSLHSFIFFILKVIIVCFCYFYCLLLILLLLLKATWFFFIFLKKTQKVILRCENDDVIDVVLTSPTFFWMKNIQERSISMCTKFHHPGISISEENEGGRNPPPPGREEPLKCRLL